ncbi:unnamed protein product, partial [Symbiodinium necroappetens]
VFSLAAVPFHAAGAAAEEFEEPAVKLGRLEDSQRMSDAGYCSREEVEMLWKQKSRMDVLFDGGHREAYWMARDEIYPEAGHRGSDRQPLGNRSGDKIEEIVSAVGKLKVLNRCKAKGRLVFADVCGAPGAWSKYFFKLGAEAECVVRGFGFSLREGTNALSCTWFPEDLVKRENFVELWGADGTGNVCLPSNVAHAAAEVGRQADLVMADGGFLVNKGSNGEHMENYQEIVSGSILLAEACLPILHCRRPLLSSSCSILRRAHDSELWKGSIESLDMFVWSICFQASSRL